MRSDQEILNTVSGQVISHVTINVASQSSPDAIGVTEMEQRIRGRDSQTSLSISNRTTSQLEQIRDTNQRSTPSTSQTKTENSCEGLTDTAHDKIAPGSVSEEGTVGGRSAVRCSCNGAQYLSSTSLSSTGGCSTLAALPPITCFTAVRLDALLVCYVTATTLAVIGLCWTDFFTALGKVRDTYKWLQS